MTKLKFLVLCIRHSQFICLVITDYKVLARKLKMSNKELLTHITHINCLTDIFVLKQVKANGVRINKLYKNDFDILKN